MLAFKTMLGFDAWLVAPYLKVIGDYYKSLENHPNPTPVRLTGFAQ